jgi:hypothetical protein
MEMERRDVKRPLAMEVGEKRGRGTHTSFSNAGKDATVAPKSPNLDTPPQLRVPKLDINCYNSKFLGEAKEKEPQLQFAKSLLSFQ